MSELKVIDLGNIRESIEKGESVYYEYYPKSEVDKLIAEKNERIVELQSKVTLAGLAEDCSNLRNKRCNYCSAILQKNKEIRRLKRALYKALSNWGLSTLAWLDCIDQGNPGKWDEMRHKCLKKVEQYKEVE